MLCQSHARGNLVTKCDDTSQFMLPNNCARGWSMTPWKNNYNKHMLENNAWRCPTTTTCKHNRIHVVKTSRGKGPTTNAKQNIECMLLEGRARRYPTTTTRRNEQSDKLRRQSRAWRCPTETRRSTRQCILLGNCPRRCQMKHETNNCTICTFGTSRPSVFMNETRRESDNNTTRTEIFKNNTLGTTKQLSWLENLLQKASPITNHNAKVNKRFVSGNRPGRWSITTHKHI